MNKRSIFLCASALLCTAISGQEVQEQQLEEVVVSDSRFPLKREHSGKTVITINAGELARNQGKSLAALINTKSGIEINGSRSNAGQNLGYYIRGGNNRQVLVLIDGIQLTDPSAIAGDYDLRLIDLSQIETIEIIKGAAGTLHGNAAATAVISITTKKAPRSAIAAAFKSTMGTNRSQQDKNYNISDFFNSVSMGGTLGKVNYLAGFAQQYTDGLSAVTGHEPDPFSRFNTHIKAGYRANPHFAVMVLGHYSKFTAAFDSAFPREDADFNSVSEQYRFGIAPEYNYTNGSIHINLAYNALKRIINSNFPATYNANSLVVDIFNKYTFNNSFYTIAGLNYIKNESVFGERKDFSITDPYANVVWVSDFGLNINAGIRFNNHSTYGGHITHNLNPSYRFAVKKGYLKLLGSYSTSYIAPNLSQLFGPFGANINLKPEENTTVEGGFELASEKFRFSGLYFNRKEENFIIFGSNGYINTAETIHVNGIESELSARITAAIQFNTNYTFTENRSVTAIRIPKHKINSAVQCHLTKNTMASLHYQYTSKRRDTDFVSFENVILDSFSLVGFYFSHVINNKKIKLFTNINNIFNTNYVELVGYTTKGMNINAGFLIKI